MKTMFISFFKRIEDYLQFTFW